MANFTSNTYTLKREILTFSNKISRKLSKPDKKFTDIKTEDTANVVAAPAKEVITEHEPPVATIAETVLETKIATKAEEIRSLKAGLSGIVRQHGFATVQDFYTAFYTTQRATDAYQKECAKWEETHGEKATPKAKTMHDKIKRYQETADRQNANRPYQSSDKGAR